MQTDGRWRGSGAGAEAREQMATATRSRAHYRVAPRRAGRASRVRWDRIGRVALVLVLFLVIASYVGPSLNVFESWRDSTAAEARLAELKDENDRLTRQAKALEGDAAAIAEARKLGMVGPAERAYVVDGLR